MHTLPDGRTLVSTGQGGVIRLWDLKTGREATDPEAYEGRIKAAYSPDGRFVAISDVRGRIDLWNLRDGKRLRTLQQEGPEVAQLTFAPDGKLLAAARKSGTVQFWQVPTGQPGAEWRHEPLRGEWFCNGLHFSPDGSRACVSDYPRQTRLVDVASGKLLWTSVNSYAEAFSPDGTTLVVALTGPYLGTIDAATGRQRTRVKLNLAISDQLGVMYRLAFSPDGRRLAVAVDGGSLMLCDGRTCAETQRLVTGEITPDREIKEMTGAKLANEVRALAFSPDGKWLAAAGSDTAVYLWEAASGIEVLRLAGHEAEVTTVAFSPDRRQILSCAADGECYLWDLQAKSAAGPRATLGGLWTDLTGADAGRAHRAVRALAVDPGAVEFLRRKLLPPVPPEAARMAKLLADLDSDSFDAREEAGRELERLGELAEAPLRKALAGQPSPEARRRMGALLEALNEEGTPATLRTSRAMAVLEYAATPEAHQLLETLTRGVPESRLTREAKEALGRLSGRRSLQP
jgi:WD40 repeat protein